MPIYDVNNFTDLRNYLADPEDYGTFTLNIKTNIAFSEPLALPVHKDVTIQSDSSAINPYIIMPNGGRHFVVTGQLTLSNIRLDGVEGASGIRGGIEVSSGGTLIMESGSELCFNEAANGGAVYVDTGGTLIMNNGEIRSNRANNHGGAVYVMATATFTMNGGAIRLNSATQTGGGIYAEDYEDITTSTTSVFEKNSAAYAYLFRGSSSDYPNIKASSYSVRNSLFNNYDLNYTSDIQLTERFIDVFPDVSLATSVAGICGFPYDDFTYQGELETVENLTADDRGIIDLSGIKRLTSLNYLSLSNNEIYDLSPFVDANFSSLLSLDLSGNEMTDLSDLFKANLIVLENLNLADNEIPNLTPFESASFPRLLTLDLSGNSIPDASPLLTANLPRLVTLYLGDNALGDVAGFEIFTGLTTLILDGNQLTDLRPLQALKNNTAISVMGQEVQLKDVTLGYQTPFVLYDIDGNEVEPTLDGGTYVGGVIEWSAYGDRLGTWEKLDQFFSGTFSQHVMETLEEIFPAVLAEVVAEKLAPITVTDPVTQSNLDDITVLVASGVGIQNVKGLEFLRFLTSLDLASNGITDLSPLEGVSFNGLEFLNLSDNDMSDGSDLVKIGLSQLTHLDLSENEFVDLSTFSGASFPVLSVLNLSYNSIVDVSGLAEMNIQSLEQLDLEDNELADLTTLVNASLSGLTTLILSGNGIVDLSPLVDASFIALEVLKLSSNGITDLTPLLEANLTHLQEIDLNQNELTTLAGDWSVFSQLASMELDENHLTDLSPLDELGLTISAKNQTVQLNPVTWGKATTIGVYGTDGVVITLTSPDGTGTYNEFEKTLTWEDYGDKIANWESSDQLFTGTVSQHVMETLAEIFEDEALAGAVAATIEPPIEITDQVKQTQLDSILNLIASGLGIQKINGIEFLRYLETLNLASNLISDLSPLAGLTFTTLTDLDLSENGVSDLTGLKAAQMNNLTSLNLNGNEISSIEGLDASFPGLITLLLKNNTLGNSLTTITLNFDHLKVWDLSGNGISKLAGGISIILPNLRELYLADNEIASLEPLASVDLGQLSIFDISGNKINDLTGLETTILTNIQELNLANNKILDLSSIARLGLGTLQNLDLSGNGFSSLSGLLDAIIPLKVLKLNDNTLTEVTGIKDNFPMLETLELDGNHLTDLRPLESYSGLVTLSVKRQTVQLNPVTLGRATPFMVYDQNQNVVNIEIEPSVGEYDNHAITWSDYGEQSGSWETTDEIFSGTVNQMVLQTLAEIFPDVKLATKVSELLDDWPLEADIIQADLDTILELDGSGLGIKSVEGGQFLTSLTSLVLETNEIEDLTPMFESVFLALQTLDVSGNKLTSVSGLTRSFPNLLELNLSNNRIRSLSSNSSAVFNNLMILNLSGNGISDLSDFEKIRMTTLLELYLDDNIINNVSIIASCFPNLTILSLSDNRLRNLSGLEALDFDDLQVLDLSHNRISDLNRLLSAPSETLLELNLGDNLIESTTGLGTAFPNLEKLSLKNNKIGAIIPSGSAVSFTKLREADLSGNGMRGIAGILALFLPVLETLDLSDNALKDINGLAAHVPGLSNLKLDRNHLYDLSDLSDLTLDVFSATDQTVQLDQVPFGKATAFPLYDHDGTEPATIEITGYTSGAITWPTKGAQTGTWANDGGTFTGTVNQMVAVTIKDIFEDVNLAEAVAGALNQDIGYEVSYSELSDISALSAAGASIEKIGGIQFLTGLTSLDLSHNAIVDLSPLKGVSFGSLESLDLSHNAITDLTDLLGTRISNLNELHLDDNEISDITGLVIQFSSLTILTLDANQLIDLSSLNGFTFQTFSAKEQVVTLQAVKLDDVFTFFVLNQNGQPMPLTFDSGDPYNPSTGELVWSLIGINEGTWDNSDDFSGIFKQEVKSYSTYINNFKDLVDAVADTNDDTLFITGDIEFDDVWAEDGILVIGSGKDITLQSVTPGQIFTLSAFSEARHIYLSGQLTLQDIVLDGHDVIGDSDCKGGIEVRDGGVLTLESGSVIQNCYALNGGAVEVRAGGVVKMKAGKLISNTALNGGGGVYVGATMEDSVALGVPGTFTMSGGIISFNTTRVPGSITNSEPSNHDYFSVGGGVMIDQESSFDLQAGQISDNQSWHHGGGVHVQGASSFTMENGTISHNTSSYAGGGVFVGYQNFTIDENPALMDNSTFNMSGGTIEWNRTTYESDVNRMFLYGGGVHVDKSYFTMSGTAAIENNAAAYCGGGVSIASSTFAMMGGSISGNMTDYIENNPAPTGTFDPTHTYGGGVWVGRSFYRTDPDRVPTSKFILSGGTIGATINENNDEDLFHSTYSKDDNSGRGNFAYDSGGGICISRGVELYISQDNDHNNTEITYNHTDKMGGGVYAGPGSPWTWSMNENYKAPRKPSAIYMSGGTIAHNESILSGGGVYVTGIEVKNEDETSDFVRSIFTFTDGTIENNNTVSPHDITTEEGAAQATIDGLSNGGGVAIITSVFNFNGNNTEPFSTENPPLDLEWNPVEMVAGTPIISNNEASHIGGGVHVDDHSSVYMHKDAQITHNRTNTWDGGILIHWKSEFYMYGGKILNNTAAFNGGGLGIISSDGWIRDGLIAGNITTTSDEQGVATGGGVMIGRSDIRGEEKVNDDGTTTIDMYTIKSNLIMSGGQITGNLAVDSGAGVSIEDECYFEMREDALIGGEIPENEGIAPIRFEYDYLDEDEVEVHKIIEIGPGNLTPDPDVDEYFDSGNYTHVAGGGVNIQGNSVFDMTGGTIGANKSNLTGGGVYVVTSRDEANEGEEVKTSIFNMSGNALIQDNHSIYGDLLTEEEAAEAQVSGLGSGGGVTIVRSKFNMSGQATIDANSAVHIGGGVFADDNSIVTMAEEATISNNSTETWDGGILIHWESEFYMNGGKVINNVSTYNGGGVGIISSEFSMTDGLIAGNQTIDATGNATGAGVMIGKSDIMDPDVYEIKPSYFEMKGGQITGNLAVNSGGGVSIEDGSIFDLVDDGIIGGEIPEGVTPISFTYEYIDDNGDTQYETIKMGPASSYDPDVDNYFDTGNYTHEAGGGVNIQQTSMFNMSGGRIEGNKSLFTGAGVFVVDTTHDTVDEEGEFDPSNFNMTGGTINHNTTTSTLDLNEVEAAEKGVANLANGGGVAIIRSEFNIGIPDSDPETQPIVATINNNHAEHIGGGVFVHDGSKVYMHPGAEISNNKTNTWDGGILIHWESDFYMYGGKIINNESRYNGGGVGIISSYFRMDGGRIAGNRTTDPNDSTGGGVMIGKSDIMDPDIYEIKPSTWVMSGGTISGNSAIRSGGGVSIEDGSTFNMFGGLIGRESELDPLNEPNSTKERAGGVNVQDGSEFYMYDGTIAYNKAEKAGGGVYLSNLSTFNLFTGATITYNQTDARAGGVGVRQSYFNMSGGDITYNKSLDRGGGVAVANGLFYMTGGNISGNTTTNHAGGVFIGTLDGLDSTQDPTELDGFGITNSSYFSMTDAIINNNSSSQAGGGVYIDTGGRFDLIGGSITNNVTASRYTLAGGGGVFTDGTLIMSAGDITGNNTTRSGGGVFVQSNGSFTMNRGTIKDNYCDNTEYGPGQDGGGGVYVNGTFTMTSDDCLISHNNATYYGGGVAVYAGVFTMEAGEVSMNNTTSGLVDTGGGGVFTVKKFIMENGTITGNWSPRSGGGVVVSQGGDFTMTGGNINGNEAQNADINIKNGGGGVVVTRNSTFTMNETTAPSFISGNAAEVRGGGVYVHNGGIFTMESGTIEQNEVPYYGGGVCVDDGGIFDMVGGVITDNHCYTPEGNGIKFGGGGVFADAEFTMSTENCFISDNKATYYGGGVAVYNNGTFNMSEGTITGNSTVSDAEGTGGGGVLIIGTFTMTGGKITDNESLRSGGGVIVSSPTNEEGVVIGSPGTFEMQGGEISDNSSFSNAVRTGGGGVLVTKGATVTLGEGAEIKNNTANRSGGGIFVHEDGFVTLQGGKIIENRCEGDGVAGGGGVIVYDGRLVLESGEIKGNYSIRSGGGIYVYESGRFEMTGGFIDNNTTEHYGGGVNIAQNGTFSMSGGIISNNECLYDPLTLDEEGDQFGGGIYVAGDFVLQADCHITGNIAYRGGGIYIVGNFSMLDGIIQENTARECGGGGVYIATLYDEESGDIIESGDFTMEGGMILNNQATGEFDLFEKDATGKFIQTSAPGGYGGGVYVSEDGTFTMKSGTITQNNAAFHGAGAWIQDGDFIMTGGEIRENDIEDGSGGGVGSSGGALTMKGGRITKNTTTLRGAGVFIRDEAAFIMEAGEISENISQFGGGGVVVDQNASFQMKGGIITLNTASLGGGIAASANTLFEMTGGIINKNKAPRGGGIAVYYDGDFTMKGGSISQNAADQGGGIYVFTNNPDNPEQNTGMATIESGTIAYNTAFESGGGIYTQATDYGNLVTILPTFSRNKAATFIPSDTTYPDINAATTSVPGYYVINNYDINNEDGEEVARLPYSEFFNDENLARAVAEAFDDEVSDFTTERDLENLDSLTAIGLHIRDLDGIGYLKGLTYLNLNENHLGDISAIEPLFNEKLTHWEILDQTLTVPSLKVGVKSTIEIIDEEGNLVSLAIETGRGVFDDETKQILWYGVARNRLSWNTGNYSGIIRQRSLKNPIGDVFKDINLAPVIAELLHKRTTAPISLSELNPIIDLKADSKGITDLEGMQFMDYLQDLSLNDNQITNLAQLQKLNIRTLHLNANDISDLVALGIKDLTNLTKLTLEENRIEEISELSDLSKLEVLLLQGNRLSQSSNPIRLENLKAMNLDRNGITDIPNLDLPHLTFLSLNHNSIQNLDNLESLPSIQQLYLNGNQIHTLALASLKNLKYLQILELNENLIDNVSELSTLNNLVAIEVKNQPEEVQGIDLVKAYFKEY